MINKNIVEISATDLDTVTGGRLTRREEGCLHGGKCFAYQKDTKGAIEKPIVRMMQTSSGAAIRGGQRV